MLDRSSEILDGRYRLVRKIAEGGMGAVYLAEHTAIGGKLAVKLLRSELASTELFRKRFEREAKINAAIRHRNIVKVFDAGVARWGEPYMAMEYLEGESLRDLLDRNGPLPLLFAIDVAVQALDGLAAAHEAGIVHRDLKPDNLILVYEGGEAPTVKIIDFGISKFAPDRVELTSTGAVLGTARYMSPEQAEGRVDLDHRTDLYSMGVLLYHSLTGAFPHEVIGSSDTLLEALLRPPVPPVEHCAGFPPAVSRVLMKALETEPAQRYQSALEMAEALETLHAVGGECAKREMSTARGDASGRMFGEIETTLDLRPEKRSAVLPKPHLSRKWVPDKNVASSSLRRIFVLVGALAVVAGLFTVLLFGELDELFFSDDTAQGVAPTAAKASLPAPVEVAAPLPSAAQGVLMRVEGAPSGSRVFWDGVLVPMNPFRVERRDTIVPLRVEADGYEPFGVAVVPEEDQVVHVAMAEKHASSPRRKGGGRGGALRDRGSASTGSQRAMDAQKAVIDRNKPELKRCYDQALARGDVPHDEDLLVHFRLDVGENGRVANASLKGTGAAVTPFAQCLEREVRSWFFLPEEAEASVVSFSFAFTTSG